MSASGFAAYGPARPCARRFAEPIQTQPISPTLAFNKRRVPQAQALIAGDQSFTLPKQAKLCCVSVQAQYQAFVRFAVESCTASAIALKQTFAFWNR